MYRITFAALLVIIAAQPLFAHCDSVKGPVITTAQQALKAGDVTPVLKWVPAANEAEIRDAFARTVKVRKGGPEAQQLADRWFFETLVRVHRQSEGEPFTGIKGAEYEPEAGIEMADAAVANGSLAKTEEELTGAFRAGLKSRFAEVQEAKKHNDDSVDAGRHYVHAYVQFIHYVEKLHMAAAGAGAEHHE